MRWTHCLFTGALMGVTATASAETIRIGIGHQSMCTDTYTAGIIVKELGLIQKHLPTDGRYENVEYVFDWKDYTSGPPITNMMLSNQLDFGVMGDYPLIVNGAQFQKTRSLRSLYVAGTGYNVNGSGNAIVVPVESDIYSFEDLKGRDISVPVGSAAWGMLLKALQDAGIGAGEVEIRNQSPPVGAANIAQGRISAHADFCPWSEIMEFRGTGRKVFDGSETGMPYLHGVVVRADYAEKYPEVVVAYAKAIIEAGDWVREDPLRAATMLEQWTGVEKEVQYLYFSNGGHLTLEPTIKPEWKQALGIAHEVLTRERSVPPLDLDAWIDDSYVRRAYQELNRDYEADLAHIHDPRTANRELPPAELWHPRDGIHSFDSIKAMLSQAAEFTASGHKLNATYVYDQVTGLKLLGTVAFYVRGEDGYLSFLRKPDAERHAGDHGGRVTTYDAIISDYMEQIAVRESRESASPGGALAVR
ncbi:MAG: ABC transporter substrate-binding protein [Aquisalimonadaceae bacterium]